MSDRTPRQRILWVSRERRPHDEALYAELRELSPDCDWITAGTARQIVAKNPSLIHAFGKKQLRVAVRAARRLRCSVIYEPDGAVDSIGERLTLLTHRPDAIIQRSLTTGDADPSVPASVAVNPLPVVASHVGSHARRAEPAELYVGIVVDGLSRHDRRLLARALSWIPKDCGISCLLFGSADDCRHMRRALFAQSIDDDWPVRLIERASPMAEDWLHCAISFHTMRSTASHQMLVDALAAGTAAIVHNTVSIPAIVDGESGLYIPPFNPFDYCQSLQYLQAQPGLLRTMAQRGQRLGLSQYGADKVAPLLLEAYGRLLGGIDSADPDLPQAARRRTASDRASNNKRDPVAGSDNSCSPIPESGLRRARASVLQGRR